MPEEFSDGRKIMGLGIASLAVLIYCYTIIYFDYIRAVEKNMYLDFDIQTITAGDYTVEFDMPPQSYEYFKEVYYKKDNPMSELAQFKLYVQEELEQRISKMPDMGFDDDVPVSNFDKAVGKNTASQKMSKFLNKMEKKKQKQEKKE